MMQCSRRVLVTCTTLRLVVLIVPGWAIEATSLRSSASLVFGALNAGILRLTAALSDMLGRRFETPLFFPALFGGAGGQPIEHSALVVPARRAARHRPR